ncbi:ABC transporter ATP-binding protein [Pseudosporangium ferrugineum]|uniref:Amino acid/amide ABC transporter ATP-binding protein 1 (HAAT family) n=1 Tax=Pseudosporangium ferrugineum TaxID=439699 RepID=A0A2T0S4M1_9ACTN|nr:ABC transporter ATP-binding protein [Pseudosporangium ferrugineum]PRY28243.1 amino acid/amide ABC transporter ATP-binding protein 1 (HAAT family) [Pseudosporangium ferrugineum]
MSGLVLDRIGVRFGGLVALDGVSLRVAPGRTVGVIGPNGAGKTTLFNVVCGFVSPTGGSLTLDGRPLRPRPHRLTRLGIARTLQGVGLFSGLTVLENVLVAAPATPGERAATHGVTAAAPGETAATPGKEVAPHGVTAAAPGETAATPGEEVAPHGVTAAAPGGKAGGRDRAMAALERCGVAERAGDLPGMLPYALRKRVALARALVSDPRILLLDEPAGGLSAREIDELRELIAGLSCAVLLVEHHMDLVMSVCDEILVLDFGRPVAHGTPDEIRADEAVADAYLGAAG